MQARDIMTTNVVTVGTEVSILAVARVLAEHRISGVPVVDMKNKVVGIAPKATFCGEASLERNETGASGSSCSSRTGDTRLSMFRLTVPPPMAVMTRHVIDVTPDTSIASIVTLFEMHRIKRVPVIEDGTLVSIVSRSNLIQVLAGMADQVALLDSRRPADP